MRKRASKDPADTTGRVDVAYGRFGLSATELRDFGKNKPEPPPTNASKNTKPRQLTPTELSLNYGCWIFVILQLLLWLSMASWPSLWGK